MCYCNKYDCDVCTGLYDRLGSRIEVGNIVHWSDGGDEYTLPRRITTRWDRIAVVKKNGIEPCFKVIDSPNKDIIAWAHTFRYGNFMYQDTRKYLTVVALNEEDYRNKFKNAGECMRWVLVKAGPLKNG